MMYRSIVLMLCVFLPVIQPRAQVSEGGVPYSSTITGLKSLSGIPKFNTKSIDTAQLRAEDLLHPRPHRYAVFEDTVINIRTSGKKDIIPGKGTIWRFRVASQQARSMQIIFRRFVLPDGAEIFIYNENQSLIRGAFTRKNMHPDSTLVLADFSGKNVIIEYFEPDKPGSIGEIIIGSISQAYRDVINAESSDGFINVNCPEGKDIQLEKHAVCKMTFRSGIYSYLCTGALINNARFDGTPYFLTAHHCISEPAEAASLVAYLNYENIGCDTARTTPLTITGSSLLSTGDSSDYSLLLLSSTPPGNAQPYFAGWNVNVSATGGVTGIHHPSGMPKKLCIDFDTIYPNPLPFRWTGNSLSPDSSHWVVVFDIGLTGGGSSGSPLFNNNGELIGQLHGGTDNIDLYGMLPYSWHHIPAGYPGLRIFLDPDSTGILALGGYSPPGNPPDAFFTVPANKVCQDAPVILHDYSVFGPYSRTWSITPSSFVYDGGTSDTSPTPVVRFTSPGSYTVKLTVDNAAGLDAFQLSDALLAGDSIEVSVFSDPPDEICECDFSQVQLNGSGAADYLWSINPGDIEKVIMDTAAGDTVMIRPYPEFHPDSAYVFNVRTVGVHGTCTDTAYLEYKVLKPSNDHIKNAISLSYGKSISYDNICATVEAGEPVPPFTSCTSQLSWCDEYGTGLDIVENSVWFKFIAPASGMVRIWSTGMDNELALYEADSEEDILNSNYELLAANDDRTTSDYHPNIRSVNVIPGKTYWVQADGSGGGVEDSFYMHLYEVVSSGTSDREEDQLTVFPQPATHIVYLKGAALLKHESLFVQVFNSSGMLILQENKPVVQETLVLEVSGWEPGVYLGKISTGKTVYTVRILKY